MQNLVEQLHKAHYTNRIFTERQLGAVLGGSDARRYGVVSRALKDGTLLRIKRGLYTLPRRYRSAPVHPFAVAQALLPGSYISFETALSFHGWIPEAVHTTSSVTPRRKSLVFDSGDVGHFTFSPLAIHDYQFLAGVERRKVGELAAFVATPLRALMDLVSLRKIEWSGLDWLIDGLRIDPEQLARLEVSDFTAVGSVYKHKKAQAFLVNLEAVLLGAGAPGKGSYDD